MTLSFPPIHATNSTRRVPISLPFPLTTLIWETVSGWIELVGIGSDRCVLGKPPAYDASPRRPIGESTILQNPI